MTLGISPQDLVLRQSGADHRIRWQPGQRLHHLFEARCDRFIQDGRSDAIAIDSDEAVLSYTALEAKANQLAHHLLAQGVRPGQRIALLFDKTVHSHIAMLAVLKLHAAYVPLDPGFPVDRMAFICEDAQVSALLSVSRYAEMSAQIGPVVHTVDTLANALAAQPATRLPLSTLREHAVLMPDGSSGADAQLCYVIYTSGSTGRPKGVPIDQAQICNFVQVAVETYGYQPTDRVYQGLTMAFDFAVEETWVPLLVGATLFPNQSGTSMLGRDLWEFLQAKRITALCCVPTLLATIEDDLPDLRLLIVSGEACPRDLVNRWAGPGRRMLNAYGPTETTVTATMTELRPEQPVTIGRPLPTYAIVILQPDAPEALPFGEIGEIGIAGLGVAVGYINRADQTAKAFIPDFLDIEHNASGRIYRTGDLGRVREDGQVEYLGRIDTQVKIRGYRIELTEIESVLMQTPAIRQAVVHTHESSPGSVELVAYYTVRPGHAEPEREALAQALREQLPSYMVPTFYECLDQMPMLASDKADRKSLPRPRMGRLQGHASGPVVAPEGPLETRIIHTLAELLSVEAAQLSVEANFFTELGANSLLMARFSARLRERLQDLDCGDVSMKLIYAQPTVRTLAQQLQAAHHDHALSATVTPPSLPPTLPPHHASRWAYLGCGVAQLLASLAYSALHLSVYLRGFDWMRLAHSLPQAYGRAIVLGCSTWGLAVLMPILVKWLLIGRFKAGTVDLWSGAYLRFWMVRQLLRVNPMVLFAGTPLYTLYLRALGAQIPGHAVISTPHMPICTDMIHIGVDSVIGRQTLLNGYRAEAGRLHIGPTHVGHHCYVGEQCVLEPNTALGDHSELGHSSALLPGQRVAANTRAHGSPAQATDTRYQRLPSAPSPSGLRQALFSLSQVAITLLLYLPLPLWLLHLVFTFQGEDMGVGHTGTHTSLGLVVVWGVIGFVGVMAGQTVLMLTLPRWLSHWLQPDKVYPLYGPHYAMMRFIRSMTNSKFHCTLMGDSSYVLGFLKALGYRFRGIEQTGSNFGTLQNHDIPILCEFGKGTMVSDGLTMHNVDVSGQSFRVRVARLGERSFVGNTVLYPADACTGDNCLFGTKTMVPIDGPLRENIGLLGSPCFEIPRSVQRDQALDIPRGSPLFQERLQQKNRSNLHTIGMFVLMQIGSAVLASLVFYLFYITPSQWPALWLAWGSLVALAAQMVYVIAIDRASLGWHRPDPITCSIYDPRFWLHERFWKVGVAGDSLLLLVLRGTPAMGVIWRALGVSVGRQLYDEGCIFTEKTLTFLGHHHTLGEQSLIQPHSLEDGVFKSDRIHLGDDFTLGTRAVVHYSVHSEDRVNVSADAFVMKGEQMPADSYWIGNPAQIVSRR